MLSELAERIEPKSLATAAAAPVPWAQRLGYLLELTGAGERASALEDFVRARAHESTLLVPKKPRGTAQRADTSYVSEY